MSEAPINIDRKRNATWLEGAAHGRKQALEETRKILYALANDQGAPEGWQAALEAVREGMDALP